MKVFILNERSKQINFHDIAQKEADPKARVRAIILNAVKQGKNNTEIAEIVGVHRVTVAATINRVNAFGIEGLHDKSRCGRASQMSSKQKQEFLVKFRKAQKDKKGGRLTGYDAQKILSDMGLEYRKSRVYEILHELELSWITSRSVHPSANEAQQENFKKTLHKK